MDDVTVARALHVFGVVLWIGGVGFVTTVLLPAVARIKSRDERLAFFTMIERRFAWQARATTLLVGVSGIHMMYRWDLWGRLASLDYWWMHLMVAVWAVFTVMLFVAEPLFLHKWLKARAARRPDAVFRLIQRLHWVLLILSLVAVLGAVIGSHGG